MVKLNISGYAIELNAFQKENLYLEMEIVRLEKVQVNRKVHYTLTNLYFACLCVYVLAHSEVEMSKKLRTNVS